MTMGIWIRSQGKKILRNCNNIMTNFQNDKEIITGVEYNGPNADNCISLGKYKTSERAQQVSNDITNQMQNGVLVVVTTKLLGGQTQSTYKDVVYQMPEE